MTDPIACATPPGDDNPHVHVGRPRVAFLVLFTACAPINPKGEQLPPEKAPPPIEGWSATLEPEVRRVAGRESTAEGSVRQPVTTRDGEPVAALVSAEGRPDRGQVLFAYHCERCHGPEGKGDGRDAPRLAIRPRDLTRAANLDRLGLEKLYLVIRDGGPAIGRHADMPSFADTLSDPDIASLIVYLLGRASE